ncbi:MAG: hypothetical protein HQK49_19990 [Oligoflexia bacterium]|nr:hypothetical protein [Oligoflexia bacterium]
MSSNSKSDNQNLGGKGKNLQFLTENNFPVPPWFCIPSNIYDQVYKQIAIEVDKELIKLSTISPHNLQEIKIISLNIKKLFLELELPPTAKDLIQQNSSNLWAIRSSASKEDSTSHSFAGQLETFLYIPTKEIEKYLKECWASAFSERVLQYQSLKQNKSSLSTFSTLKVAVIIQKMVDAKISGVIFTVNPHDVNSMIICAGYGLGEGIVSDTVESDTYIIDKNTKQIIDRKINQKRKELLFDHQAGIGLKLFSVSTEKQNQAALTDEMINKLFSLSSKIEKLYACPQDIEWAIDKDGNIFITQARPITTLGNGSNGSKSFILDNSNIVESFPGINTPMTLSIVRIIYATCFNNALKRIGLSTKDLDENQEILNYLIGHYNGRIFYNLTNWYAMMRLFPFTENYIRVWETMLGVESKSVAKQVENQGKRILRGIKGFITVIYLFIFLTPLLAKLERNIITLFSKFTIDKNKSSEHFAFNRLVGDLNIFIKNVFKNWELTLINDIYAFVFSAILRKLLSTWITKENNDAKLFNGLLCGVAGMDSVGPIKSIVALSELKENDPKYNKLFQEHVERYGDRGIGELKLETITIREQPQQLKKLIQEYASSGMTIAKMKESEEKNRIAAEQALKSALKFNPLKYLLYLIILFVLHMAKRSILYREKFRLHRSRAYGIVRSMLKMAAKDLQEKNIIENVDDIFFLELSELIHFIKGQTYHQNLKELISIRKKQYHEFQEFIAGERYIFTNGEFKLHQNQRKEDQEKNKNKNKNENNLLKGDGCSSGIITAPALVITDVTQIQKDTSQVQGKILVAPMTDPGWVFLMTVAKGLIVEKGSILSHTAIIGRELGIPTIVGVKDATKLIKNNDSITMNGESGEIYLS